MNHVFRNKNYTDRNYEATNVIACVVTSQAPDDFILGDRWVADPDLIISNLTHLYTQSGVRYYGHL